jgi:hypothetical protein
MVSTNRPGRGNAPVSWQPHTKVPKGRQTLRFGSVAPSGLHMLVINCLQGHCPCLYSVAPSGLFAVPCLPHGGPSGLFAVPYLPHGGPCVGQSDNLFLKLFFLFLLVFIGFFSGRFAVSTHIDSARFCILSYFLSEENPWGESCSFMATWVLKVSCRETDGFSAGNRWFLGRKLRSYFRLWNR